MLLALRRIAHVSVVLLQDLLHVGGVPVRSICCFKFIIVFGLAARKQLLLIIARIRVSPLVLSLWYIQKISGISVVGENDFTH